MPTDHSYQHRWSGWPGAFCVYCGAEDAHEADPDSLETCWYCLGVEATAADCKVCSGTGWLPNPAVVNPPCPAYDGTDPYQKPWPSTDGGAGPAAP